MISKLYVDRNFEAIMLEEKESIVQYLHHVSMLRKMLAEGRYEKVHGDHTYKSKLLAEYDMSDKEGIAVTKIKRLFVVRMVMKNE